MNQTDQIPERDANDVAVLMSYRSDRWTGQAISPARYAADLLEDLNQPYDVLLPERDSASRRSPGQPPIDLELSDEKDLLRISLPTLQVYGIVRLAYA